MFNFFKKKNWQDYAKKAEEFYEQHNYEKVIEFASLAVSHFKGNDVNSLTQLGSIYFYWGYSALILNRYEEAEEALTQSLEIGESLQLNDYENRDGRLLGLAQVYLATKRTQQAYELLVQLEKSPLLAEIPNVQIKFYILFAEANEALRRIEPAIAYFEKYLELLSSLYGKESKNYHGVSQHKDRLLAAFNAKKSGFPEKFISIKYENGGGMMMDSQYANYLVSDLPNPSQESLDNLFLQVQKIQVIEKIFERIEGSKEVNIQEIILLEDTNKAQIVSFTKHFLIDESRNFGHVMCNGKLFIRFFTEKSIETMELLVNGSAIRWANQWSDDANFMDTDFIKRWLMEKGIERQEF